MAVLSALQTAQTLTIVGLVQEFSPLICKCKITADCDLNSRIRADVRYVSAI